MKLPFQIHKTFTTTLSQEEVMYFVRELLNRRSKFLFISSKDYTGSIDGSSFNVNKIYNSRSGPAYPKVKGTIININPTTIEIKITPNYSRIFFFSIFPIIFLTGVFIADKMTINNVLREPEFFERVLFGLFAGVGPMIWCYFDNIRPIKHTESWIIKKLGLEERSTY